MKKDFFTVGEVAQLMGTTVRTLQYYDKQDLLKPSTTSEGGRRLYSSKDLVKLHQIMSFKYLGFSLDEIKEKLFKLDTPNDVAMALERQKKSIEEQIVNLEEALQAINSLYEEVIAVQEVDFSKYAEIIEFLRAGNQGYWVWKYFDEPLRDHIRNRFGDNSEAGLEIFDTYKEVLDEAVHLKRQNEPPESEKSLNLAQKWWNMILAFTGGDMNIIPQLEAFNGNKGNWNHELAEKQQEIDDYVSSILNCYLSGMEKE